jgi:tetratricopeptide (TPR) repeat protein
MALPYLEEVWIEHQSTNTTTYDSLFVQDGLNLAGLYFDRGSNELAIAIYERLLAYDKAHLQPTDPRIGRDWNNLGLCCLQTGEALPQLKFRKEWFLRAIEKFATAEKIFSSSPKSEQQLVCSMQNLVVAYSELGEDDKAMNLSNLVSQRLDAWHDQNAKISSDQRAKPGKSKPTNSPKSMIFGPKFSISSGSAPQANTSILEIKI